MTLASIVEKETGKAEERPRVASVFVNRLLKHMKLQSDPTIVYGLVFGKGSLGHPITKAELQEATPYNTYFIDGLPPGPICNPGRAALEAVANPAKGRDLFFVADGTGGHAFAETLDQHQKNVTHWRQIEKDAKEFEGPSEPRRRAARRQYSRRGDRALRTAATARSMRRRPPRRRVRAFGALAFGGDAAPRRARRGGARGAARQGRGFAPHGRGTGRLRRLAFGGEARQGRHRFAGGDGGQRSLARRGRRARPGRRRAPSPPRRYRRPRSRTCAPAPRATAPW